MSFLFAEIVQIRTAFELWLTGNGRYTHDDDPSVESPRSGPVERNRPFNNERLERIAAACILLAGRIDSDTDSSMQEPVIRREENRDSTKPPHQMM